MNANPLAVKGKIELPHKNKLFSRHTNPSNNRYIRNERRSQNRQAGVLCHDKEHRERHEGPVSVVESEHC